MGKTVNKYAKAVTKFVGGQDLAKYAGEKRAKKLASPETKKYVSQTVSGKRALISGAKLVASIIPAGAAIKVARVAKAAKLRGTTMPPTNMAKFNKTLSAQDLQEKRMLLDLNKRATLSKNKNVRKQAEKAFNDYFKKK